MTVIAQSLWIGALCIVTWSYSIYLGTHELWYRCREPLQVPTTEVQYKGEEAYLVRASSTSSTAWKTSMDKNKTGIPS